MELAGPPQPPSGTPTGPPEAPASKEDLRSLRRWIVVAGVWAVAATALAIIALVSQDDSDTEKQTTGLASQVSRIQRTLDRRIDDLEKRIQGLPQSEDLSKLERRLGRAEDDTSKVSRDTKKTGEKLSDLEKRVDDLEKQQGQSGGTTTPESGSPP
jgi:septal ring factor EnvC (AmiA/AmiB activator)